MKREIVIDGFAINDLSPCYVIAEIGANHQGEVSKCKELFKVAKECGVNAVKLQKRNNRELYTRTMFESPYENRNSYGRTYGEHREFLEFDREQYIELQAYARELDVTFFATPFDFDSADFLAELDIPVYKIASGDLTNTPLIKHVAAFGKPLIISTGGGTMEDVVRAYDVAMAINPQLCIMQCTSGYPPEYSDLNLRVIDTFRQSFPTTVIGYSGHDNGIAMPVAAYMQGARMVEKHFTLNRTWKGTDQVFSLAPDGMRKLVRDLHRTHEALGSPIKRRLPIEEDPIRKMAKKLVAARDLTAGAIVTRDDVAIRSPGDGLPPYELERLIGLTLERDIRQDEPFTPRDLHQA